MQSPSVTYFSESVKVAIEQLLLSVIISSGGKSEVSICTAAVLLFQHSVEKGTGEYQDAKLQFSPAFCCLPSLHVWEK